MAGSQALLPKPFSSNATEPWGGGCGTCSRSRKEAPWGMEVTGVLILTVSAVKVRNWGCVLQPITLGVTLIKGKT